MSFPPKTSGRSFGCPKRGSPAWRRCARRARPAALRTAARHASAPFRRRPKTLSSYPAEHGCARHQRDVGKALQLLDDRGCILGRRHAADGDALESSDPPKPEAFIRQDDAEPSARKQPALPSDRPGRRRSPKVAMRPGFFVAIRICDERRLAEAGGFADDRLVELFPEGFRPPEGLVVEAGREKRRQQAVDGADVVFQRRPAVLAIGLEPLIELGDGRPVYSARCALRLRSSQAHSARQNPPSRCHADGDT